MECMAQNNFFAVSGLDNLDMTPLNYVSVIKRAMAAICTLSPALDNWIILASSAWISAKRLHDCSEI